MPPLPCAPMARHLTNAALTRLVRPRCTSLSTDRPLRVLSISSLSPNMPMEKRYFSASNHHNNNATMKEDEEEWYDSLKGNDRSSLGISGASNARKSFKEVPVHPSILRYIESIGVGIPKGEIIVIGKDRSKVGITPKEAVEETTSSMQHLRRSS